MTTNALRRELTKAGLQGRLSANAFKVLLQHVLEVQGSRDVLNSVLATVKQGTCKRSGLCSARSRPCGGHATAKSTASCAMQTCKTARMAP